MKMFIVLSILSLLSINNVFAAQLKIKSILIKQELQFKTRNNRLITVKEDPSSQLILNQLPKRVETDIESLCDPELEIDLDALINHRSRGFIMGGLVLAAYGITDQTPPRQMTAEMAKEVQYIPTCSFYDDYYNELADLLAEDNVGYPVYGKNHTAQKKVISSMSIRKDALLFKVKGKRVKIPFGKKIRINSHGLPNFKKLKVSKKDTKQNFSLVITRSKNEGGPYTYPSESSCTKTERVKVCRRSDSIFATETCEWITTTGPGTQTVTTFASGSKMSFTIQLLNLEDNLLAEIKADTEEKSSSYEIEGVCR